MTQEQGRLSLYLAICIYLNLLDLLATLSWCWDGGWHMEMNPLMQCLFAADPYWGILVKLLAVIFFAASIQWAAGKNFAIAHRGTQMVALIYAALLGWHLLGPRIGM